MRTERKIYSPQALITKRAEWRLEDWKVVFTNGCFDILHLGHVDYLERAADLGDRLIVGVNSDTSVHQLKGSGRPVSDQYSRMRVMAAFEFVDAVVMFDEQTPLRLIKELVPDVLVKGGDYEKSNIVGAEIVLQNGGIVETIALVAGHSTTRIIEKIKT